MTISNTFPCVSQDKDLELKTVAKGVSKLRTAQLETSSTDTRLLGYLSLGLLCLKLMCAPWLKLSNLISRDTTVPLESLDDMPTNFGVTNVRQAYDFLTGDGIVDRSGGAIKPLTPQAASGLIGGWMVETGSDDLSNLDVVEKNNNQAGRGISQFSHGRRGPYDAAREAAISAGIDPNSMEFQLGYAVDEYTGKHDPAPGKSLSGWTNAFETHGQSTDVAGAATGFTNDYFRPSTPHMDRRIEAAERVHSRMTAPQPVQDTTPHEVAPTYPVKKQDPYKGIWTL